MISKFNPKSHIIELLMEAYKTGLEYHQDKSIEQETMAIQKILLDQNKKLQLREVFKKNAKDIRENNHKIFNQLVVALYGEESDDLGPEGIKEASERFYKTVDWK